MGIMRDVFSGFMDGLATGGGRKSRSDNSTASDHGRVERLCDELNWPLDEKEGDVIRLYFTGPDGEKRKVRIGGGDKSIVSFSVASDAVLPASRVSPEIMASVLRRNVGDDGSSGIGTWGAVTDDDDDVVFLLYYAALGDGLNAATLKYICESMSSEASTFDDKLREAGLLE
jgi:hypothetical protein